MYVVVYEVSKTEEGTVYDPLVWTEVVDDDCAVRTLYEFEQTFWENEYSNSLTAAEPRRFVLPL